MSLQLDLTNEKTLKPIERPHHDNLVHLLRLLIIHSLRGSLHYDLSSLHHNEDVSRVHELDLQNGISLVTIVISRSPDASPE